MAWSHRQYLGRGRSAAVYICTGCGLAYRGREGQPEVAPARRRQRPLPDQGPPDNPVLDAELARRLQEMISKG